MEGRYGKDMSNGGSGSKGWKKQECWEAGKLDCREVNDSFTLMIPEIPPRNHRISSLSKTGDMSARPALVAGYR